MKRGCVVGRRVTVLLGAVCSRPSGPSGCRARRASLGGSERVRPRRDGRQITASPRPCACAGGHRLRRLDRHRAGARRRRDAGARRASHGRADRVHRADPRRRRRPQLAADDRRVPLRLDRRPTRLAVDAVVNAANERMLGGAASTAPSTARGPDCWRRAAPLPSAPGRPLPTGERGSRPASVSRRAGDPHRRPVGTAGVAARTRRWRLPTGAASRWRRRRRRERRLPAISTGVYAPGDRAARVAVATVRRGSRARPAGAVVLVLRRRVRARAPGRPSEPASRLRSRTRVRLESLDGRVEASAMRTCPRALTEHRGGTTTGTRRKEAPSPREMMTSTRRRRRSGGRGGASAPRRAGRHASLVGGWHSMAGRSVA